MARGGARPGAGRPRKAAAPAEPNVPKPRGGARPGAGRKKKAAQPVAFAPAGVKSPDAPKGWPFGVEPVAAPVAAEPAAPTPPPEDDETIDPNLTPLEYLLQVMRGQRKPNRERMAAAQLAAPFMHAKKGESKKTDAAEKAAKAAGSGKFGPSAPPPRLVSSR